MEASTTAFSRRNALIGIALIALASMLWSLNGALIKIISNQGQGPNGISIAFYRSLVAGLFLLPLTRNKWTRQSASGQTSSLLRRPAALWCVLFFALMTLSFVVANTITQAASVILLQYTSTFWIFGLSPMILKERPRTSDLWILALAMIGIVIIFFGEPLWNTAFGQTSSSIMPNPSATASSKLRGMTIALASGLLYALLTLMIRRLRDANSAAVTVMNNLGSAVLLFPLVLAVGGLSVSSRSLSLLILMGIVQFGVPYYFYTLGLKRIPAYQAALITLLEPVLVPIWAVLAIGASEMPPIWTLLGGGVIFLALLLFVNAARRNASNREPA
jgi:drug/metabolite transporter (DMT)-like permease